MRRLLGRWVAVLAVVAGLGVGASTVPATAAPAAHSGTAAGTVAASGHTKAPALDWWY